MKKLPRSLFTFFFSKFFSWRRNLVALLILISLLALKFTIAEFFVLDAHKLIAGEEKEDLLARRAFLIERVTEANYSLKDMPQSLGKTFQGEWAFGTLAMTAYALTNLALEYPETQPSAKTNIEQLISIIQKDEFKTAELRMWNEDPLTSLDGDNGHIGYLGHFTMMLAAYRVAGGDLRFEDLHRRVVQALVRRLEKSEVPLLETYPYETYLMDNVVMMAAIAQSGRVLGEDYSALIVRWIKYVEKEALDPNNGVMTFWAPSMGMKDSYARGSGTGWNSFFLPFISPEFARTQYERTKSEFARTFPLGLAAIKEYPKGRSGWGDVDSGPVIFGMSPSGSGFIISGARRAQDYEFLQGLLHTAEWVGSSLTWNGKRRYLFAPLVGDAIMLAMLSAREWDERYVQHSN